MKVTAFNIEWMNDLFYADEPKFKKVHTATSHSGGSISDVAQLCRRIQSTIRAVNPDILGVVEGPKLESQMEKFVHDYLTYAQGNPEYSVTAGPSKRTQRPYLLVRKGLGATVTALYEEPRYLNMTKTWKFNAWGTYEENQAVEHRFHRKPLVAELDIAGRKLTLVLLHIKSKHIGEDPTNWVEYVKKALSARQEITSEIKKVRDYLDDALLEEMTRSIIVMGDLNDGPGRDFFEEYYMLQNLVDVIQGTLLDPEYNVYHVLEALKAGAFSVDFMDPIDDVKRQELIDHILLSPAMLDGQGAFSYRAGSGKVEHEAWQANVGNNPDTKRDDRPSDHRPVSCEID